MLIITGKNDKSRKSAKGRYREKQTGLYILRHWIVEANLGLNGRTGLAAGSVTFII